MDYWRYGVVILGNASAINACPGITGIEDFGKMGSRGLRGTIIHMELRIKRSGGFIIVLH